MYFINFTPFSFSFFNILFPICHFKGEGEINKYTSDLKPKPQPTGEREGYFVISFL